MELLPSKQLHFLQVPRPSTTISSPFHSFYNPQSKTGLNKCKKLSLAHQAFDDIPVSDTFAWNNLIQLHLTNKEPRQVITTYHQMLLRGVVPDKHTLPRVLSASHLFHDLQFGKQVHGQSFKLGFSSNLYVITALIELYANLDSVNSARWVFDKSPNKSSVSWTLLAKMYMSKDKPRLAIHLFYQMVKLKVDIDPIALATTIVACGRTKRLQDGKKIHQIARKCGFEFEELVFNSLLKMYIDCESIRDARDTFDQMVLKDVVAWTEMIRAYVKRGEINEGFKLFRKMNMQEIKPDSLTISSILPACGRMAAYKHGREIHASVLRNGIDMNIIVENAIMDMYVKSGSIELASKVFSRMKIRDAISWTVIILGYSVHGQGKVGVKLFQEMEKKSIIHIDQIMYSVILHACSTALMVEEGKFYFNKIIAPKMVHFALMTSLLARSGQFNEAKMFIEEQKIEKQAEVLRALLDGCRIHKQMKIGKRVIDQLCDLEPLNSQNYVMLSNWYAKDKKWDMVEKIRETIRDMGLDPKKAYSWIEFRNKVHVFGTGDVSHPRSEKIYWQLECLMKKMEEEEGEGYRLESDVSFHDVDEERECILNGHSELLALSFGLISTQEGSKIRITKNARVCDNCHDSAKKISKIVGREIVLKDSNCFHHFRDGFCSCGDLW